METATGNPLRTDGDLPGHCPPTGPAANSDRAVAAQAVGGAVGHNPVSIIVPCHRVVGRDGSLTGYAGGLDRKAALLRLEGVELHQNANKP